MKKRILVTGGAGFLGSHLCKKLLDQGNDVIALDNLYTGSKRNIAELNNNSNFEFIRHDITQPIRVEVDEIYNLACPAAPIHYQKHPVETITTCVMGAINVLNLATRLNIKVLQASTSEVYGDPIQHPQKETYWGNVNPVGVRSCYDEGKRAAETLFFDYHRGQGTKIKVVRIFNTYGPNMSVNDGRVVSNFIIQALQGEDITIYGEGLQTRSFCYVDDMVDGFIRTMEKTPDDFTGPINIGNDNEFTMRELAEKVIQLTGTSSKISYLPLPKDDPTQRKPELTLAREMISWKPTVELAEGLEKTINYFKTVL